MSDENDEMKLTRISVDQLKPLQEQYSDAGATLAVRVDIGRVVFDEIILVGPMKAHLIENANYSLVPDFTNMPLQWHRVQFEDGGWCWLRRGDSEGPDVECHGVDIEIIDGRLIIRPRNASKGFPDADNPPNQAMAPD